MTALHYCIQLISIAKGNLNKTPFVLKSFSEEDMRNMAKTMPFNTIFDDELLIGFANYQQDLAYRLIEQELMQIQDKYFTDNRESYHQIFEALLPYCDVNIPQENLYNISPLIFATEIEEVELVRKLLESGANKNHKNIYGKTAYDYAEVNHNIELMSMLR